MNKELMKKAGLGRFVDLVEQGLCPFCESKVNLDDFMDDISLKEFEISGLCQKCQDSVFTL